MDRLAAKGWVKRLRSPKDKKAVYVGLTEEGVYESFLISATINELAATKLWANLTAGQREAIEQVGDGLKVAELEFPVGGMTVPIKLVLPPAVKDAASGLVDQAAAVLRGLYGSVTGIRVWQ